MDIGERQRKLSLWAEQDKEFRFFDLYGLLYNHDWLTAAHDAVAQNAGSATAGTDGINMYFFDQDFEGNFGKLREELKTKTFEPEPVRRAYIPKANGTWRPLGIPAIKDRIVQEALRMILEPIWEADFDNESYGFRPGRCTMDAVIALYNTLRGSNKTYQWVIEGDISSYFDTIPHRKLMKCVKKRIQDEDILDLLWKFLRAGVLENGKIRNTMTGTPQGGIISPLLANIYLHEFDTYMREYTALNDWTRRKRRSQGLSNFIYVRYADDWVILCNGTRAQAEEMKGEVYDFLKSKLDLTLSLDKTKITHITEGFKFLGYWLRMGTGRNGKPQIKIEVPDDAVKRMREKIHATLAPTTHYDSVAAKIMAMNKIVRGWCNYYRYCSSPTRVFYKLEHVIWWDIAHWIAGKYQISIPQACQRYRQRNTFGTKRVRLVMPSDIKTKQYMRRKFRNPYTAENPQEAREELFDLDYVWLGTERRRGKQDIREAVIERDGLTCKGCGTELGHYFEAQVDHITARAAFKRLTEAERLKNHQVLCTDCHRAKTKSDRQVLSRMR
jgi:group II intron reverse transcriptase/maturase